MKTLLALLILFGTVVGIVIGDENIYGPGDVNLGPNGDPEQHLQEIEQQRQQQEQFEQQLRQHQEAINEYESGSSLTLHQQKNGHYVVDGAINDIPLVFVIDTGASFVTLSELVASKAGIECENNGIMETANGSSDVCMATIARLKFGDFSITDVKCVIAPNVNYVLLGSNVLEMFKIHQQNREMRITK
jgi:clan AA aspartic protease (TIGR02281 family)